jgi:hypothetical protein
MLTKCKEDLLKMSKAFIIALDYLGDGKSNNTNVFGVKPSKHRFTETHLCCSLDSAVDASRVHPIIAKYCKDVMHDRMFPSSNVYEWLNDNGYTPRYYPVSTHESATIQQWRAAWALELSVELESMTNTHGPAIVKSTEMFT